MKIGSIYIKVTSLIRIRFLMFVLNRSKFISASTRSTDEVSAILGHCSKRSLPLVVQGGKTSLVAGSVPTANEIILSMARLNKVDDFDETSGILTAQAGCILQTLEEFVDEKGYTMPYDLGAKGSCQIGGNIASNAGGLRYIRYGSLHGSVLGLEVVLADGKRLDLMSSMRKDNTGYDLKQLFIGSEGTLGVITRATILCPIKPKYIDVDIFGVDFFDKLLQVYRQLRKTVGDQMSAFEMFDIISLEAVTTNLKLNSPLKSYPFYVLTELSSNDSDHMMSALEQSSAQLFADDLVLDGTYSNEVSKVAKMWAYRERIVEALLMDGYCYKYDISVPLTHFYEIVEEVRRKLAHLPTTRVCGYGHVGDSNLHLNITSSGYDERIHSVIEPWLFQWISERKGSISAEHGLGIKKRNYIHYSKSPEAVQMMKQIKTMFDPNYILNPGKLLPD